MVSALSARLMGSHEKKKAKTSHIKRTQGSQSGYSADLESANTAKYGGHSGKKSPPVWVDLHVKRTNQSPVSETEDPNKKRRLEEITYDASIAKISLTNVGISCPQINTKRSRISPFIDLSTVHHVHSSPDDDLSHFRSTQNCAWKDGRYDVLTDFGLAYTDMIRQTSFAYQCGLTNNQSRHKAVEDYSDTSSSLSDTESEDSHTSMKIVVLHARLDDAIESKTNSEMDSPRPITHYMYCPPSVSISIEDAIGFRDSARLITQALPPYRVVFANSAFQSMSGMSDNTSGKALQDIVTLQKNSDAFSLESCAAKSVEGESIDVIFRTNGMDPQLQCCMIVTPIMSRKVISLSNGCENMDSIREINDVTHFAVDFMPSRNQRPIETSRFSRHVKEQSYVSTVA
jgi:hypothetical protein